MVSGSPEYMAPEQLMGEPLAASDIYALGVVAYEMITGRRQYEARSPAKLYSMQAAGSLPRPSELRPVLPEVIDRSSCGPSHSTHKSGSVALERSRMPSKRALREHRSTKLAVFRRRRPDSGRALR
jgi:serine/threonine protein kinase